MKKCLCVILLLLLLLLQVGCASHEGSSDDSSNSEPEVKIEEFYREETTYSLAYTNAFTKKFVDAPIDVERVWKLMDEYVPEFAHPQFKELYEQADDMQIIPIFGSYLEPTSLFACLFYQNKSLIGVRCIDVYIEYDGAEEESYLTDYQCDSNVEITLRDVFKNEKIMEKVLQCRDKAPDFTILGLIFDSTGYIRWIPVGMEEGKNTIQYYIWEVTDFSFVEPFETLEAGSVAFAEYLQTREQIFSEIKVYPWKTVETFVDELGYINTGFEESGSELEALLYSGTHDSVVAIPLYDANGKEEVYILHLLYDQNRLIAEVVVQRTKKDSELEYQTAWQNISEKDSMGKYVGIESPTYVDILKEVDVKNPNFNVQGVFWVDQTFVPVGYVGDTLQYYNPQTQEFLNWK